MKLQDTKSIYKRQLHFYKNELSEKETIKNTKNLGMYLTKRIKDLYTENCKTLVKEIEEDTNG